MAFVGMQNYSQIASNYSLVARAASTISPFGRNRGETFDFFVIAQDRCARISFRAERCQKPMANHFFSSSDAHFAHVSFTPPPLAPRVLLNFHCLPRQMEREEHSAVFNSTAPPRTLHASTYRVWVVFQHPLGALEVHKENMIIVYKRRINFHVHLQVFLAEGAFGGCFKRSNRSNRHPLTLCSCQTASATKPTVCRFSAFEYTTRRGSYQSNE